MQACVQREPCPAKWKLLLWKKDLGYLEIFIMELRSREQAACGYIAREAAKRGGRAYCVGGAVRDWLLGEVPKDVDVEVYGIEPAELEKMLKEKFRVEMVGKNFGVWILKGLDIDVSIPRRESKTGLGHKDFSVDADPYLSVEAACARRDFTVNAILYDFIGGEFIDPYGGMKDLKAKLLRHTSDKFSEDPLRVLRAMQFAARFGFDVAPETVALCSSIRMEALPIERVYEEWKKLILKGVEISRGLNFLKDCGWVKYFPELEKMVGCPQDPVWHPEGDVYTHTGFCMDSFAEGRIGDEREDLIVGLAVLCHDMGKPLTTEVGEDGKIHSYAHDVVGCRPALSFLERLTREKSLIEAVLPLVERHMAILDLWRNQAGDSAIRRLANKVGRIDRLVRVDKADRDGRPPLPREPSPQGEWILKRAEELAVKDSAPKALILGRHLIALGLKPSAEFSEILDAVYEAQLDGAFADEASAVEYLKSYLAKR